MINAIKRLIPSLGDSPEEDKKNNGQYHKMAINTRAQLTQLHLLHRSPPWLVCFGSLLMLGFLWPALSAHTLLLAPVAIALLMLARYNMAIRFAYIDSSVEKRWLLLSCLPAILGGTGIALLFIHVLPKISLATSGVMYLLLLTAVLIAMLFYAIFPPAFFGFAVTAITPIALELFLHGDDQHQLAALCLLLVLAISSYGALIANRFLIQQAKFKEQGDKLQRQLQQAQQKLAHAATPKTVTEKPKANSHPPQEQQLREKIKLAEGAVHISEQRLSMALEVGSLTLWDWDLSHDRFLHPQSMEMLGIRMDGHQGFIASIKSLVTEQHLLQIKEAMQHYLNNNTTRYQIQYRARHKNGQWLWLEDNGHAAAWDQQGRVTRVLGTRKEITLEKQREAESSLFRKLSELSTQAVFLLDHQLRFVQANNAFCELSGFSFEELHGKQISQISPRNHDAMLYQKISKGLRRSGYWSGDLLEYRKDGQSYPVTASFTTIDDPQGNHEYYLGVYSDLSQKQQNEKRLHFLTSFDGMTGLANRDLFLRHLQQTTQEGKPLTLLMLNLDRFKQINESLGHEVGDQLLIQASRHLRKMSRDAHLIARTGSDEFAVLFPGNPGLSSISELTQRILSKVGREYRIGRHELTISISAGICLFPQQARNSRALLQGASKALLEAKKFSGNHHQFYTDNLADEASPLPLLEGALPKAVRNKEFEVYYQPKLHLDSNRICGVEALVRWQHPQLGLVEPERFIYLAEENGLIHAIGEQVMVQACTQAKQWLDDGLGDIQVSVNLSAQQLRQGNGPAMIERTLQQTGLPHHLLELELTEGILLEESSGVSHSIDRIRDLGVSISIDDFGTGYASLSYLRRFPVNALKIDRSFISGIPDNENDCTITRAIIAMANSLDLQVIAEGVESPQHADFLRDAGCHYIQGYLISRPVPAHEMSALLTAQLARDPES